jgi:hypothetical protein
MRCQVTPVGCPSVDARWKSILALFQVVLDQQYKPKTILLYTLSINNMKIVGAAVLAVSCLPYSAAFVGLHAKQPHMTTLNLMLGPDTPVEVITGEIN